MKDQLNKIEQFHTSFGVKNGESPSNIDEIDYLLRYDLMKEENDEYLKACQEDDLVEIADALGDKLVILCGTILKHGMQNIIEDVFAAIHDNNMSKLDENGKPIINGENGILDTKRPLGKILKPSTYRPVDITHLVK